MDNPKLRLSRLTASGFTLVELVAVIVLLGIIAAASSNFISGGARVYMDSMRRDNLGHQGRFAIERVARELRDALPGSVRVGSSGGVQCVEFYPVVAASSYLNSVTGPPISSFQAVEFDFTTANVAGEGYQVAIYTIDANPDVYVPGNRSRAALEQVNTVASNQREVELDSASGHRFLRESPQQRFYIIQDRVSFCASDNQLVRYQGYSDANAAQDIPPAGGQLLAEGIRVADGGAVSVFSYTPGSLQRAGVISLDFRFSDSATNEWVRFSEDVALRNTP